MKQGTVKSRQGRWQGALPMHLGLTSGCRAQVQEGRQGQKLQEPKQQAASSHRDTRRPRPRGYDRNTPQDRMPT